MEEPITILTELFSYIRTLKSIPTQESRFIQYRISLAILLIQKEQEGPTCEP